MTAKTLKARTALAIEAYERGDGLVAASSAHRIHRRTLERALEEAGIAKKPPPGHGVAYTRHPKVSAGRKGRPEGSKNNFNDYEPGPVTKTCVRCNERPSHPGAGGRCWPCDQVRVCRCNRPVPLTSSPEAPCKACGFQIVRRRA